MLIDYSFILIRALFWFANLNGITSFNVFHAAPFARFSYILFAYSLIFASGILYLNYIGLFVYVCVSLHASVIQQKTTIYLVYVLLISINMVKSVSVTLFDIWNRKQFMNTVLHGFELKSIVMKQCCSNGQSFLHKTCRIQLLSKLMIFIAQIFVIMLGIVYVPYIKNTVPSLELFVKLYVHVISATRSSLFYCGLFIAWQFYLHLNGKLKQVLKSLENINYVKKNQMKIQIFCDLSDDVDQLAYLHNKCLQFTENIGKLFSIHIFATIFYGFLVILGQV